MTTREVYFKAYVSSEIPVCRLHYVYKDAFGVIQIGRELWIAFRDGHEENIKRMYEVEKTEGFMFWGISEDGHKFFKENCKEIGRLLFNMVIKQK